MAACDSIVKKLLWLTLPLLLIAVACKKAEKAEAEIRPIYSAILDKSGAFAQTAVDCKDVAVKVSAVGATTTMVVKIEASDDDEKTWNMVDQVVNPREAKMVPIRLDSNKWIVRAKSDGVAAGQAQVEFFQRCP